MPAGTLTPIGVSSCRRMGNKGRGRVETRPQVRAGCGQLGSQRGGEGRAWGFLRLWNPPGSFRNPHTLVEVTSFAAINKFQPFNVAISSNVLFLLVCAQLLPCPLGVRGSQAWAGGVPPTPPPPEDPWKVGSMRAETLSALFTTGEQ